MNSYGQFQLRCRLGQATSADIQTWCLKTACLCTDEGNIQKNHKNHSFHISISSSHRVSCSVYFYSRKSLFRSFVILTIAVIYLKLLLFIVTYRQLYKKCSNSVMPWFQAVLTYKKFMRFASRQMIFECAILFIAVKILSRQKGKTAWHLRLHRG